MPFFFWIFYRKENVMCTKPKVKMLKPAETEVIKTAVRADASVQKATPDNRGNSRGVISSNIKTSNNGLDEEVSTSKKKLLGE